MWHSDNLSTVTEIGFGATPSFNRPDNFMPPEALSALIDIREAGINAVRVARTSSVLDQDSLAALIYYLAIVGEAVKRLPLEFRDEHGRTSPGCATCWSIDTIASTRNRSGGLPLRTFHACWNTSSR